jgi:polysaccharide export outer membrane protein
MCPEPGEEEQAQPIDGTKPPLQIVKISELRAGRVEANPVIRPGDYVLVTEAEPVYIYGAVASPNGVYLREGLTLTRALAMVGGTRNEAKLTEVAIYRTVPGSNQQDKKIYDVGAIRKNKAEDPLLQAYDIIEVPEAGIFSKQRIGPTLMSALTGGFSSAISSTGMYLPNKVIY